jgi:hypothetical protein
MDGSERARVVVARGPRAAELELVERVARLAPRDPSELAAPLRVIVPSASLRRHLLARLVASSGRALAGVVVQTLQQVALEVLERAGEDTGRGTATFELLVRRSAARDPGLRQALADLDDGYGAVESAVRDLLDAGYGPHHQEAVLEKIGELRERVSPPRRQRARALIQIATEVAERLDELESCRLEQAPQRAAETLRRMGASALPSRALVIHGFADLTGVAADLVQTLLAVVGGAVLVDRPPDPAAPEQDDAGAVFLDRLEVQLGGLARERSPHDPSPPRLVAFAAPTADAEVRQVAHRVHALLDAGAAPESVGIVARELRGFSSALRRHLDRLAIPFSGAGATMPGGTVWRMARLLSATLRGGPELPAELWLQAVAGGPVTELLLALRSLGVSRLAEVAGLGAVAGGVPLPLPVFDEDGEPQPARVVAPLRIEELREGAFALVRTLEGWPARAAGEAHRRRTAELITALGWSPDDPATRAALREAERLEAELPRSLRLTREEWRDAYCRRLEALGEEPVGGTGGGVQLLSAMEARARTFERLFIIGLNRGVFPRVIQDDPLLPDEVRGHLAAEVLPEFPVKARGLDEERYLFAQLVASAAEVTLSWHLTEGGSAAAPSPLVERLRRGGGLEGSAAPAPLSPPPAGGDDPFRPRPAFEHAALAAEHGPREVLAPLLAMARIEGRDRAALPAEDASGWALARIEILDAIDPTVPVGGPGPWSGLVGEGSRPGTRLPSVTRVEGLAECPFQALLVRRLGMAPMPDPRSGLPDTRGALVGSVVHAVLERIVADRLGRRRGRLDELADAEPVTVAWPDDGRLEAIVAEAAASLARRHGLVALGMAPLLAAQARPFLAVARAVEWGAGGEVAGILGAEVAGELKVAGLPQPLAFRADRVERGETGLSMVDYKTSAPPSEAQRESTRRRHLLRLVARGDALQGVAYALAVPGQPGEGRYLHLRPELGDAPEEARQVRIVSGDAELATAFARAVAAVAEAWRAGAMFARVEEPDRKDGRGCEFCSVKEACLRDDSGFRRRLVAWLAADDPAATPIEEAARRLWRLGFDAAEVEP